MSLDRTALQDLLASVSLSGLITRSSGTRLRGKRPLRGRCPFCGGTSREPFWVRDDWGRFGCHACGVSGNAIGFLREFHGFDFQRAIEELGGRVSELLDQSPDMRQRADELARQREEAARRDMADKDLRDRERARALLSGSVAAAGTPVETYLASRGIRLDRLPTDLRFHPSVAYWGYADTGAGDLTHLGDLPCMLAVIRDVAGNGIGLHRTFLTPTGAGKLSPPGDALRNGRKKVLGRAGRGHIDLRIHPTQPWPERVYLAEGIESALSAWILADREDAAMSGISLGNIAGGSIGRKAHPQKARATIPDGRPDPERPGIELPDAIRAIMLCGDGDSNRVSTTAHLTLAATRFGHEGRDVFLAMAPDGQDWNDVLKTEGPAA
jgi:hypothetical protein